MALMSAHLDALRIQLSAAEPADRGAIAVTLAELEPLLGHRVGVVRDALHAAGVAIDLKIFNEKNWII